VVAIVYTLFAVTRCAVLIYLATFPFVTARVARVEERLKVVESALAEYRRTHGSFPATLLELELTKSALVDPWGFEYGLHRCASQADCVEVRCVGMPSYYFAPPFHAEPVVLRKVWVSKSEM
jgi:hypothetical protein